jgi:hypothetical protein
LSAWKKHSIIAAVLGPIAAFLLFSCASAPEFISEERPVHFLPASSQVLGKINAVSNEALFGEIIGVFLGGENTPGEAAELRKALGRTENVYFAYNRTKAGMKADFSIIIQGRFPKGITESLIKKEEGWEKQSSDPVWYKNALTGLEFAVPEKGLIFFSTGLLEEMLLRFVSRRPADIAYEALKEFEVSDIVLYVGDPASGLLEGLPVDTGKFPLESIWFALFTSGFEYRLSGVFLLTDEKKAQAMAMLSKILMIGWFRQNKLGTMEELKEQLSIAAAGASVRISGVYLDDAEVLRLLFSFLPEDEAGLP